MGDELGLQNIKALPNDIHKRGNFRLFVQRDDIDRDDKIGPHRPNDRYRHAVHDTAINKQPPVHRRGHKNAGDRDARPHSLGRIPLLKHDFFPRLQISGDDRHRRRKLFNPPPFRQQTNEFGDALTGDQPHFRHRPIEKIVAPERLGEPIKAAEAVAARIKDSHKRADAAARQIRNRDSFLL